MTTNYTIYLVNQSSSTQTFWCFLERPKELVNDKDVYANSSVSLAVASFASGINTFTIPVQYVVGAGASNKPIGLDVKITSSVTENAELQDTWNADYITVPPKQGPSLSKSSEEAPENTISIISNDFNQAKNEAADWFSNMSFGIQTDDGFIGMTWSPNPQKRRTITPKLKFYVAVGGFGENTLASWTEVSVDAAEISVPRSFKNNNTTVTYTSTGKWEVTPGKPPTLLDSANIPLLVQSHFYLSKAHADLVALSRLIGNEGSKEQKDTVVKVIWKSSSLTYTNLELDPDLTNYTFLSGTLTVATALTAAFLFFTLSGVYFQITSQPNNTTVQFTYNGTLGAQQVKDLLVAGATVIFGGQK